jgi:energy-coupling factor transporter ATP-binding protein EcfA2
MSDETLHRRAATDRVVRTLYGETAVLDSSGTHWLLASILGGRGDACRIERASGLFRDASESCIKPKGDLIDAVALVLGKEDAEAARWIAARCGGGERGTVVPFPARHAVSASQFSSATRAQASPEHARRLRARLLAAPAAMDFLKGLGLSAQTIKRFGLGLGEPQPAKKAGAYAVERARGAITAPIIGRDGLPRPRLIKIAVPGLGARTDESETRCPGAPATYWSAAAEGAADLFIVSRVTDLWRVAQAFEQSSRSSSTIVIASSDPGEIPAEWLERHFWQEWRQVYICCSTDRHGSAVRERIRSAALRDILDVVPPGDSGWIGFFLGGGTIGDFEDLLARARPVDAPVKPSLDCIALESEPDGFYGAAPININAAWVHGHLYYPVSVRETLSIPVRASSRDAVPQFVKTHRYCSRVVRSDGAILDCRKLPAPAGTSSSEHVVALSDGTVITAIPTPREFATWRWESIGTWKRARDAGQPPHRHLREIIADVRRYLERMTWLAASCDYALLAAYVAMTFVYAIFDAVPNLLITGRKGSGKSTTAEGLAGLCFNGSVLGAGSTESLIRFLDQGRGFLVLDDLEKVGRTADENGYGQLSQFLKLAYSKIGARKSIGEGMKTRLLDFFGPKCITNISGIDPVNRSRMFCLNMRTMPSELAGAGVITGPDPRIAEPLRQELHAWAMTQARAVNEEYQAVMSARSDRFDEICAPIRTVVQAADDAEFEQAVEEALRRQDPAAGFPLEPVDCLESAVLSCLRQSGSEFISLAEVQLALASMLEKMHSETAPGGAEAITARWIVRKLRELGIIEEADAAEPARHRLYGEITKIYRVHPTLLRGLHASANEQDRAMDGGRAIDPELAFAFCEKMECPVCPYIAVCEQVRPNLKKAKLAGRGASAQRQSRGARGEPATNPTATGLGRPDHHADQAPPSVP